MRERVVASIPEPVSIKCKATPRGVLSDAEARTHNVGGEVLAEVF